MDGASPVTQLLVEWSHGNRAALDELTPHVYRELHALAKSYLRRGRPNQTLQPTALINEACLRLLGQTQPIQWENRAHFFGIAARLMRMVLVDYSRTRKAGKRGGSAGVVTLEDAMALTPSRAPDVLEVSEALDHLAKVDERKAKVIELRYFGGMDREEIGAAQEAMSMEFADIPIVPHELAGVDCCGCIIAVVEDKNVELRCNECGAVMGVIQVDILRGLVGLDQARAACPH